MTASRLTRAERVAKGEEALRLHRSGMSTAEIAVQFGVRDAQTIRNWMALAEPQRQRSAEERAEAFQSACLRAVKDAGAAFVLAGQLPLEVRNSLYVQYGLQALAQAVEEIASVRMLFHDPVTEAENIRNGG